MPDLIEKLARLIVHDNAVLFVGTGLSEDTSQRIAEILARRIDYQRPNRSLPAVAQDFEVLRSRQELIQTLQEELESKAGRPSLIHQIIADAVLPHTKVITTHFDRVLELALEQFDKPYVLIVRDTDLSRFDESRTTLIKIQGDIGQPDSLVITEDDMNTFIRQLPTLSDVIKAFFATKTLIFLGYDLEGDHFKRLFDQVAHNLSAFQREAYAVVRQSPDEATRRYWKKKNVQICPREPVGFLEALAQAVKGALKEPEPTATEPLAHLAEPPLPPHPYKALDSFTRADAAVFAGRADESQQLANRVLANRLTLLYGESGSGKTSLLQAGTAPLLAEQSALLAVCAPAPGQPLPDLIRRSLEAAREQAALDAPPGSDLAETIRIMQRALNGPVTLAVDQFEQFFLAYSPSEREEAAYLLADLLTDRSLNLRLVMVIREDFVGQLQKLSEQIPDLLGVRFRLERLGREAARAAIVEPARRFDAIWEPSLVQTLLDDLYDGTRGGVAPPQLQIACHQLYENAVDEAAGGDVQITLAQFREMGGTQAILGDYLDRAVTEFEADVQPTVRALLGALVGSSGVKQRLGLPALARAAEVEPSHAKSLLAQLTRRRLVRRFQVAPEGHGDGSPHLEYELTHDYLAARIARWLGDDFWAAQKAREVVRQALPDWQSRDRLPPRDDLRLVAAQRGQVRFSDDEREMLYAAAVSYDHRPEDWASALPEAARRQVLLRLATHPEPFVRERAARHLAPFSDDVSAALVRAAVGDSDANVRRAAARAVVRPEVKPEALAQIVRLAASEADGAATEALIVMRDAQPAVDSHLPQGLARRVRRGVWAVRWQRHRQQILADTLRGMQGGFAGLGLGIGLFLGLYSLLASGFDRLALPWQTIVSGMSVGVPLAGVIGMLAAGSGGFVGAVHRALQDRERTWRRWLAVTATSAAVLGLGFLLLAYVFGVSSQARPLRSLLAGVLIGLGLAGAATAPIKLAAPLRLGLATLTGVAAFVLTWTLGLIFDYTFWWLLFMGIPGSLGFFWGLNPHLRILERKFFSVRREEVGR